MTTDTVYFLPSGILAPSLDTRLSDVGKRLQVRYVHHHEERLLKRVAYFFCLVSRINLKYCSTCWGIPHTAVVNRAAYLDDGLSRKRPLSFESTQQECN